MDKQNTSEHSDSKSHSPRTFTFEKKWLEEWQKAKIYRTPDHLDPAQKFYCLDMFPYPSGAGLHVGHVEGYTASDIVSRFMRMNGHQVLHPMGWDAFGLPAENYAIKTGIHPNQTTDTAIATFKQQMNSLGLSYDWEREIQTSKPEYYKWTQWMFLLLYKNGLAYKKMGKVNWCEHCMTVLANEQAEGGVCERCGNPVIQKNLKQWFLRITDFIEDQDHEGRHIKGLLSGLNDLDWPESTKSAQINWIGRSEGSMVKFKVVTSPQGQPSPDSSQATPAVSENGSAENSAGGTENGTAAQSEIEVFTTRPDTLFGCTYMAINPEHPLLEQYAEQIGNLEAIRTYAETAKSKTELERTDLSKDKTGLVIEGLTAINPVNGRAIKIFVADYVLSTYGTGAVMAVPSHDDRDYEFAKKYDLEMIEVVSGGDITKEAYTGEGIMVNSGFLDGLKNTEAKTKMIEWLEENGQGNRSINYRLRDWLISRQRYWGAPIPMIHCEKCGTVPVPEQDLPVLLPEDVDFKPTGESPLVYSKTFHQVTCPQCGAPARRESDTMDTFACSSWYFLRFLDPHNSEAFADKDKIATAMPVDVYIGGAEHTVLHLLYARFFNKVLQKYGYIDFNEPFLKLRHQGTVLAEDGTKMSKSKGNVINPNDEIAHCGADGLRLYEMFMGVFNEPKPWNTKNIIGVRRFLDKVEALAAKVASQATATAAADTAQTAAAPATSSAAAIASNPDGHVTTGTAGTREPLAAPTAKALLTELHKTIKKVGDDIRDFKFNTAISQMMIMVNTMAGAPSIPRDIYEKFLLILAPFAPFTTEELWARLGNKPFIHQQPWPKYDPARILEEKISLSVQVNGKMRGLIEVDRDASEEVVLETAKADPNIGKYLADGIKKHIYVPNKILNFVV